MVDSLDIDAAGEPLPDPGPDLSLYDALPPDPLPGWDHFTATHPLPEPDTDGSCSQQHHMDSCLEYFLMHYA
ncbi:hypothetical protein BJG92_02191 [Arthrobacter sp. SO5]|nr:hypothetical protein [Arthrobacter sp. SO5]